MSFRMDAINSYSRPPNQRPPTSFAGVLVNKEVEKYGIKKNIFVPCTTSENEFRCTQIKHSGELLIKENEVLPNVINDQIKKKSLEDEVSFQHVTNTSKTELLGNFKRTKETLQTVKKRYKNKPVDYSPNLSFFLNERHTLDSFSIERSEAREQNIPVAPMIEEKNVENGVNQIEKKFSCLINDNKILKHTEKDSTNNDDIQVLSIALVEKNITVITLLEEEETKITQNGKIVSKRKPDFKESLQTVKKLSVAKAAEYTPKRSLPLSYCGSVDALSVRCNQIQEQNVAVMIKEKNLENGVTEIKKEKIHNGNESSKYTEGCGTGSVVQLISEVVENILVITLSDDEEEEDSKCQEIGMEPPRNSSTTLLHHTSSSTALTKPIELKNISTTDILRQYNIVPDLDKYECQAALEYLSNYKGKSKLADVFSFVKKERKSKCKKEDSLLKNEVTKTNYDSGSSSVSQGLNNISNEQIFQTTSEHLLQYPGSPTLETERVLRNVDLTRPSTCIYSSQSPILPTTSNVPITSLNQQPITDPSELNSNLAHTRFFENNQDSPKTAKHSDVDSKIFNLKSNPAPTVQYQTSLKDTNFKERSLQLENKSETHVANTADVCPQVPDIALPSSPNTNNFPTLQFTNSADPITSEFFFASFHSGDYQTTSGLVSRKVSSTKLQTDPLSQNVSLTGSNVKIISGNKQSTSDSSKLNSNVSRPESFEQIKGRPNRVKLTDIDSKTSNMKSYVSANDHHKKSLQDPNLQKKNLNLENKREISIANTVAAGPQLSGLTSAPKHTFPALQVTNTPNPSSFQYYTVPNLNFQLTTELESQHAGSINLEVEPLSNTANLIGSCTSRYSCQSADLLSTSNGETTSLIQHPKAVPSKISSNISPTMSFDQIELKSKRVKLTNSDSKTPNIKNNVAATDRHQTPLQFINFREEDIYLGNRRKIQAANTAVVYPQVSDLTAASKINSNFPRLKVSNIADPETFKASSVSLPNHDFQTTSEHVLHHAVSSKSESCHFNLTSPSRRRISSQSTTLPVTSNVEMRSFNQHPTADPLKRNLNISDTMYYEQVQLNPKRVKLTDIDSKHRNIKNNTATTDCHQTALKDTNFHKKYRNLENSRKIQIAHPSVLSQVSVFPIPPLPNPAFLTLPVPNPSYSLTSQISSASLINHDCQTHLSQYSSFPGPASEYISQYAYLSIPFVPQYTMLPSPSSIIPSSSNFEVNPTLNLQPLPATSILNSNNVRTMHIDQAPVIPGSVKFIDNNSKQKHKNESNTDDKGKNNESVKVVDQRPLNDTIFKKKRLIFKTRREIQHVNTAVVHSQVSVHKTASLPNPKFPTLPVPSNSSSVISKHSSLSLSKHDIQCLQQPNTFNVIPSQNPNKDFEKITSAKPSLSIPHDPRLLDKKNMFAPRKGKKDLLLYQKVGKEDITEHFETLILQWNPSWVKTQFEIGKSPPICRYFRIVTHQYPDEMAYYNTYVSLHLLHIWFTIYECFVQERGENINCIVQEVEKTDEIFKISCTTELEDSSVEPIRDDILYCMQNNEETFLRVQQVQMNLKAKNKFKIFVETLHDLNVKPEDKICFKILINIRTACLKTEALKLLNNNLKDAVLNPERYASCIKIVQLDKNRSHTDLRNDIMQAFRLDPIRVIVVKTYHMCDIISIITLVSLCIVKDKLKLCSKSDSTQKPCKVLIILKNDVVLFKLFRRLHSYDPILAVRSKQINLPTEYIHSTLDARLQKKEKLNSILNKQNIFLSTFSAFGSAEKARLSKIKSLTCIIDEANSCTEVETALPLTLNINKLLLVGNQQNELILPEKLKTLKYNLTLFDRLLKAKLN